eukprot:10298282-Alexandrium_andersonii.AAC.1
MSVCARLFASSPLCDPSCFARRARSATTVQSVSSQARPSECVPCIAHGQTLAMRWPQHP